ncbi:hypothetical protein [Xenophilus sp. Marseille-Q4582]|uniref:hypothetical protein n=1 Tax=Xenophilus sp. Marseille-Q4582 TaxID=2866600 RepID=UPI001CE46B0D|nr:hypothetical protein [Xenophilus sp. Marseille-Q4582]
MPSSTVPVGAAAPHLLIPFASHPGVACRMALRELDLPHLQALLARLAVAQEDAQDESTLSPPHERALARARGLAVADGLLPWAALAAEAQGLPQAEGQGWGLLTLCHWQVGLSEVVLGDPPQMGITAQESDALLALARPFFEEDGLALFATPEPGRWLVRGALLQDLPTASVDRAVGQPLAPWLPMGDAARPLRRLQNEIQMLLYTHRVNDDRAAHGMVPINSFWLSGTGRAPAQPLAPTPRVAGQLRESALQDDGAGWARCWTQLDAQVLAPLCAQADAGQPLTLTLCGARSALRLENRPRGLGAWLRSRLRRPEVAPVLEAL